MGHAILGLMLWGRAKSTDLESKSAITSFYMFIWQVNVLTNSTNVFLIIQKQFVFINLYEL